MKTQVKPLSTIILCNIVKHFVKLHNILLIFKGEYLHNEKKIFGSVKSDLKNTFSWTADKTTSRPPFH